MVSGQLEDSLRHELESYIEGRISGIKQEIAALQSQLNESLSRLLDRQADVQLDSSVAASILEHLRAAHEEGIDVAAAESSRAKASSDMAIVKAAISGPAQLLGARQSAATSEQTYLAAIASLAQQRATLRATCEAQRQDCPETALRIIRATTATAPATSRSGTFGQ